MPLGDREINGKMICLQYKYGNKNNYFSTYEETIETVKKYPIVYTVIPEKFKDKEMTLALFKANRQWMEEYHKQRDLEYQEDIENRQKNVIKSRHDGRFVEITNNAIIHTFTGLGELLHDEEILFAAVEYGFPFDLSEDSYLEPTVKAVLKKKPLFIWQVYEYWTCNISKHPKEMESIRVKNELYNMPSDKELAFFKCRTLLDNENMEGLMELIAAMYNDFDSPTDVDNVQAVKKVFALLDAYTQNVIVNHFYYCARFLKKNVLDLRLEQDIARLCPIAGDILSDEAVLKYKLEQSETEEERQKKCGRCSKCQLARVRIV